MWQEQSSLPGLPFHPLSRGLPFRRLTGGVDGREDVGLAEKPTERPAEPAERERKTTGAGEDGKMEPSAGAEIWFNEIMVRGQVDDFVVVWSDRGMVQNYLLRDGSSCRIGEGTGEGFTWSSSIGWSGRLEATQGLLSLSVDGASGSGSGAR